MAHSHYVVDLYYPLETDPSGFRRDVLRIEAKDDEEATTEGLRISAWRNPSHFTVRSIQGLARKQGREIYDSRANAPDGETADDTATIIPAASPQELVTPLANGSRHRACIVSWDTLLIG